LREVKAEGELRVGEEFGEGFADAACRRVHVQRRREGWNDVRDPKFVGVASGLEGFSMEEHWDVGVVVVWRTMSGPGGDPRKDPVGFEDEYQVAAALCGIAVEDHATDGASRLAVEELFAIKSLLKEAAGESPFADKGGELRGGDVFFAEGVVVEIELPVI
jgi:hypothetical protein